MLVPTSIYCISVAPVFESAVLTGTLTPIRSVEYAPLPLAPGTMRGMEEARLAILFVPSYSDSTICSLTGVVGSAAAFYGASDPLVP